MVGRPALIHRFVRHLGKKFAPHIGYAHNGTGRVRRCDGSTIVLERNCLTYNRQYDACFSITAIHVAFGELVYVFLDGYFQLVLNFRISTLITCTYDSFLLVAWPTAPAEASPLVRRLLGDERAGANRRA